MSAPTLTDFLLARIAEDEKGAHDALAEAQLNALDNLPFLMRRLVVAHGPHRVLTECEAKRQIIEYVRCTDEHPDTHYPMKALALPYSDHPDYRPEWKLLRSS